MTLLKISERRKIGELPIICDEYGYSPNVFSASVNRALARYRQKDVVIDEDLIKNAYDRAARVAVRFDRRYGEPK